MIKSFNDLEAYQRSQEPYPKVVVLTRKFPREAKHLCDQVCRSANSIHANIAEGYGRSTAEFKLYLTRALGSCNETISHLNDVINSKFADKNASNELVKNYEIVGKQIYRLREKWK